MSAESEQQLTPARLPTGGTFLLLATVSVFLSASLLFAVQPLFARMTLPLLGGAPGVWTTALAFYQTALVVGYLYADRISNLRSTRNQALVHLCVLAAAALVALPLSVSTLLGPPPSGAPIPWLLGIFSISVGAPFVALAATAPLVQAWVAKAAPGVNPYPLYAASNAGSFISLLAYPFLIEPIIGVGSQRWIWSVGFVLIAGLLAFVGYLAAKRSEKTDPRPESVGVASDQRVGNWRERFLWAACAFAPSLLLSGVTAHIATDVASGPFLWVIPLALYLMTFVVAFADRQRVSPELMTALRTLGVLTLAAAMTTNAKLGWLGSLALHLAVFVICALACHMELARRRPDPSRLTDFYLWMSIGGACGGIFAGLIAPVIFDSVLEYRLALIFCLLVGPWVFVTKPQALAVCALVAVATGAYLAWDLVNGSVPEMTVQLAALGIVFCALFVLRSPPALGAFAAIILLVLPLGVYDVKAVVQERSFFGVLRVKDENTWRTLTHGTTLHGVASLDPARARDPLSYYASDTPLGATAEKVGNIKPNATIGVIGLGAGSLACHAKAGQTWKFFEIDPAIVALSTERDIFQFLKLCTPKAEVIEGDARLTLAQQPLSSFDYLLVDAFSSDMVPAHLLTREALNLYISRLKPGGVAVLHLSNRYMALIAPVIAGARANGHAAWVAKFISAADQVTSDRYYDSSSVTAVMIAATPADLEPYFGVAAWENPKPDLKRAWTDDHADLIGSIIASRRGEE